ncbi:MAG: tRNA (adenosine(37)-N6)-dimethylallyltransferase MiaA, partial [Clostridiales bacterium]|nr:tRNA (adenosine(37)-N6)-dimethylallyltransferase MiaA [Clostridiales bacterium]
MNNEEKQNICIIAGPTAVGKSDISIKVAKALCGEIISADSAQVYKYMDIGTAKLKNEEMQGIRHYMIDEVYPDEKFSAAVFRERALPYIDDISERGNLPIIVGGTGLYIKSLLDNFIFTGSDEKYRKELRDMALERGNEYVHDMLKDVDIISYEKLHPYNLKRIIRALEVYKQTGKPITYFQEESKRKPSKFNLAYICLNMDREKIYKRINERVDLMVADGLIEEVEGLLYKGYDRKSTSLQALGYKEIIYYLVGEMNKEEAIELLKKNTRNYAKRQLTWFKGDERVFWVNVEGYRNKE